MIWVTARDGGAPESCWLSYCNPRTARDRPVKSPSSITWYRLISSVRATLIDRIRRSSGPVFLAYPIVRVLRSPENSPYKAHLCRSRPTRVIECWDMTRAACAGRWSSPDCIRPTHSPRNGSRRTLRFFSPMTVCHSGRFARGILPLEKDCFMNLLKFTPSPTCQNCRFHTRWTSNSKAGD